MNNRILVLLVIFIFTITSTIQAQVGINEDNSQPDASALLDVKSSNKGILIPRMTSTERTNINAPAQGLMVYDNTTNSFWYYAGTAWREITSGTVNELSDADGDTKIQVEKNADDDSIRIDISGEERLVISKNAGGSTIISLPNNNYNTFFGENAGKVHAPFTNFGILGLGNTFIGNNAGASSTRGNYNTFLGHNAGTSMIIGSSHTFIGVDAGRNQTGGIDNVYLGKDAGYSNISGSRNVFIGSYAGNNNVSGTKNVFIGDHAGANETGSEKLYIDNSNTSSPLIYGDFATNTLRINGSLNINGAYTLPTNNGTNGRVLRTDGSGGTSWGIDSDNQNLSLSNHTLSLSNDNTPVDLSTYHQDLSLSNDILSLTNDNTTVDLSSYLDNTDNQDLSISNNTLSLTNDNTTVDLSDIRLNNLADTDNDTKIQIEKFTDEDIIRFDANGTEQVIIGDNQTTVKNDFQAGLTYQSSSTKTLDYQIAGGFISNGSVTSSDWQSFKPTVNGKIDYVELIVGGGNLTYTISIYKGEGTNGTLMTTTTATAPTNGITMQVNITDEVILNAGEQYTIGFNTAQYLGQQVNITPDGRSGSNPGRDFVLKIYTFGENYGINIANGELNINNAYALPTSDGSNGQVLRTDGSGGLSWITLTDSDHQNLYLNNNTLSLTNDNTPVDLSSYLDNTDNQDLSISNHTLSLTNDNTPVDLSSYLDNTDNQDLSISNHTLSLTNDNTPVDLSSYLDNTDKQDLSISNNTLSLTNDNTTVDLSSYLDNTDNQDLSLSNNTLSLTNDNTTVDLSSYLDNTDNQSIDTLQLNGENLELSISNNGQAAQTVDLSSFKDSKWDTLSNNIYTLNSGNIGIGTNTPKEKLDVNGSIQLGDGNNPNPTAGAVRWNSTTQDFEGFMGDRWASLTYGNGTKSDNQIVTPNNIDYTFGSSVCINGNYAIIGSDLGYDNNGNRSGVAYIFKKVGTTWTEQAKLIASDAAKDDYFGSSVSISGDYAIIGAYGNDDNNLESGSAYIFMRNGTTWTEQAKLIASDAGYTDYFGSAVSISGDYAIIGAYGKDDKGSWSGAAYIFKRNGTTWTEQTKLTASDGATFDFFGSSVSISGDYTIIGARYNDDNGSNSGSAYIFMRNGTTWTEQAKLTASDGAAKDYFGNTVSISGDYAIIGAPEDDDNGSNSGSAYIFMRNGTTWIEQAKLTASDGAASDQFGLAISISGNYAVIGALTDDDHGNGSGSAYVFKRVGTTWTEQEKLTAPDAAANNYFGKVVAISNEDIVVGPSNIPKLYFFKNERPDSIYVNGKGMTALNSLMSQIDTDEINVNGQAQITSSDSDQLLIKNDVNDNTTANIYFDKTVAGATQQSAIGVGDANRDFFIWHNGSDRLNINENGLIGINRMPTTNQLEVDGNASKATAGDWLANSDARLKKNIQSLPSEQMLDQLLALQGVTYEWNDTITGNNRPEGIQYGFTAQNIQEVFPTLVTEDNQGYLQTAYGTYDAMYVEAFRALNGKIEQQNQTIAKLQENNQKLQTQVEKINQLEAMLQQLQGQLDKTSMSVSTEK